MDSIARSPFFSSWSGGKDSCLALYHAILNGGVPRLLFTMMDEGGETSHSHGLSRSLLEEQSRLLGIPIAFRSASWGEYETVFLETLREFKKDGIETGVFGDIDIDASRKWVQEVCSSTGIIPFHPLWQRSRRALIEEFINLGFKATVVMINNGKLDPDFLGRAIDSKTIAEMEKAGIDASGELGEYHTVVSAGPIFSSSLRINVIGRQAKDGYLWLEITGPQETAG